MGSLGSDKPGVMISARAARAAPQLICHARCATPLLMAERRRGVLRRLSAGTCVLRANYHWRCPALWAS